MSTFVPENTETCVRIGFALEKEETKLTRTFAQMPFVPSDETLKRSAVSRFYRFRRRD